MASLDRIVNVQISLNTAGVSREGFSTGIIVGPHAVSLSRVETYTSIDDMLTDGFEATDPLYVAASDWFSQTPRPSAVKIGRVKAKSAVTVATVQPAGTYTLTVKTKDASGNVTRTPYAFTNTGKTDPAEILAGIAALVAADSAAAITATVAAATLTVAASGTADYAVEVSPNLAALAGDTAETLAQAMTEIVAEDNDFYGIILTSREQADILAMAAWAEAHRKLFGTAVAEPGAYDASVSTDTGSKLEAEQYFRTYWFYHADAANDYPEAGVMARCFAIQPGGETWANKRLGGVKYDNLTETQFNAIKTKNGNTFEQFRNIAVTQNGKVAAGEWIDVIRFRDWLQEEITTNVFTLLVNNDKVPYTDAGIAMVEGQIRAALELGQERGGIAPTEYDADGNVNLGFTITVPLSSSISATQKASRILTDVTFTARLAGAIHVVEIRGSLTYENLITGEG